MPSPEEIDALIALANIVRVPCKELLPTQVHKLRAQLRAGTANVIYVTDCISSFERGTAELLTALRVLRGWTLNDVAKEVIDLL